MQAFREINRRPSRRELLQFALIVAAGAALLGVLAQYA
jgi:preprotein translocase subunit Sss1